MNAEDLKAQVPMEKVLHFYGSNETNKKWNCPFGENHHNADSDPSASVRNGRMTCHSQDCLKGEDIIALVQKKEHLSFVEACGAL